MTAGLGILVLCLMFNLAFILIIDSLGFNSSLSILTKLLLLLSLLILAELTSVG